MYKVPIFSLYEKERKPSVEMLRDIDLLFVDLQDVGTRVYTFTSTLLECMRVAAKTGTKVLVLDRPNPLGGEIVEGPILRKEYFSFVGNLPIPMRHGLTMGELAAAMKDYYNLDLDLEILTMDGWKRHMFFEDTGLAWQMPSPNMPSYLTAIAYSGTVLLEATNISEGRGTTRPFEIIGAPFLNPYHLRKYIEKDCLAGICLQEYTFRPTFNKWAGKLCHGYMIHVTDKRKFRGMSFALGLLAAIYGVYSETFSWKLPPYEYEYDRLPIDIISGTSEVRKCIENRSDIIELIHTWEDEYHTYLEWRRPYLLY